jgi:hypothetical protein
MPRFGSAVVRVRVSTNALKRQLFDNAGNAAQIMFIYDSY